MRTFTLKDDCTLSGRRLHRDERSAQPVRGTGEHCSRVEGGGYLDPAGGPLVLAHGFVEMSAAGMKKGEKEVLPDP